MTIVQQHKGNEPVTTSNSTLENLRQEILGRSDALVDGGGASGIVETSGEFVHLFDVGSDGYLLPAGTPAVLLELPVIRRMPFSPVWFEGLVHHRGDLVPVYDLRRFLNPDGEAGSGRYLLIIGRHEAKAGLRVDQIFAQPLDRFEEVESGDISRYTLRKLRYDGKICAELDLDSLFDGMMRCVTTD